MRSRRVHSPTRQSFTLEHHAPVVTFEIMNRVLFAVTFSFLVACSSNDPSGAGIADIDSSPGGHVAAGGCSATGGATSSTDAGTTTETGGSSGTGGATADAGGDAAPDAPKPPPVNWDGDVSKCTEIFSNSCGVESFHIYDCPGYHVHLYSDGAKSVCAESAPCAALDCYTIQSNCTFFWPDGHWQPCSLFWGTVSSCCSQNQTYCTSGGTTVSNSFDTYCETHL